MAFSAKGVKAGCRAPLSDVRMTQQDVAVLPKRALRSATARRNHIAVTSYACSQARCLTSASGNNAGLNYEPTPCPSLTHPPPLKLPPKAAARATDSGPSKVKGVRDDAPSLKMAHTDAMAAAMPYNPTKASEHGFTQGLNLPPGSTVTPASNLPPAARSRKPTVLTRLGRPRRWVSIPTPAIWAGYEWIRVRRC